MSGIDMGCTVTVSLPSACVLGRSICVLYPAKLFAEKNKDETSISLDVSIAVFALLTSHATLQLYIRVSSTVVNIDSGGLFTEYHVSGQFVTFNIAYGLDQDVWNVFEFRCLVQYSLSYERRKSTWVANFISFSLCISRIVIDISSDRPRKSWQRHQYNRNTIRTHWHNFEPAISIQVHIRCQQTDSAITNKKVGV